MVDAIENLEVILPVIGDPVVWQPAGNDRQGGDPGDAGIPRNPAGNGGQNNGGNAPAPGQDPGVAVTCENANTGNVVRPGNVEVDTEWRSN